VKALEQFILEATARWSVRQIVVLLVAAWLFNGVMVCATLKAVGWL
jgi:hypothetical protein